MFFEKDYNKVPVLLYIPHVGVAWSPNMSVFLQSERDIV